MYLARYGPEPKSIESVQSATYEPPLPSPAHAAVLAIHRDAAKVAEYP